MKLVTSAFYDYEHILSYREQVRLMQWLLPQLDTSLLCNV